MPDWIYGRIADQIDAEWLVQQAVEQAEQDACDAADHSRELGAAV